MNPQGSRLDKAHARIAFARHLDIQRDVRFDVTSGEQQPGSHHHLPYTGRCHLLESLRHARLSELDKGWLNRAVPAATSLFHHAQKLAVGFGKATAVAD